MERSLQMQETYEENILSPAQEKTTPLIATVMRIPLQKCLKNTERQTVYLLLLCLSLVIILPINYHW